MVILLTAIGAYPINGYWWLFRCKPLVVILLMVINGYCVTKREGPRKLDDAYTTCPRPPAPTFYRSFWYSSNVEPLMLNLPTFSSRTHHASTDCRTQQHIILQTTCTQKWRFKNDRFVIIFTEYLHPDSTSMSFITKQQVLAPSLVLYSSAAWTQLPIRCSGNPRHSRSSDATEIFPSQVLLFSKLSLSSPKLPPSLMHDPPPYFFCSISYTPFYSLHCPKLSLPPTDSWSFILRGLLLLPDAFPKLSVPIKSDPESAVSTP